MAVVHNTTLVPSKVELLSKWLPSQPWYRGATSPDLSRAGGFRLDDPADEVGIELVVVNDVSGSVSMSYLTPLTYRGAPLPGAEDHLIGTTEHGVLGRRWVYDGVYDSIFVEQVLALLAGDVEAQAQGKSNTVDPTVSRNLSDSGGFATLDALRVESDNAGTEVNGLTLSGGPVTLNIVRALDGSNDVPARAGSIGEIVANWTGPNSEAHRGLFVFVTER
jgi:hypothetical protein